jgi:hypothetical protein
MRDDGILGENLDDVICHPAGRIAIPTRIAVIPWRYIRMKRALISGVTGQDGSFLVEFLLVKGYEVHGILSVALPLSTRPSRRHLFGPP